MTAASGNAFAQKALNAILAALGLVLTTFFVWLATTVIDIRERVVRIEATAKALSDARDRELQSTGARNAARIDRLEGAERGR